MCYASRGGEGAVTCRPRQTDMQLHASARLTAAHQGLCCSVLKSVSSVSQHSIAYLAVGQGEGWAKERTCHPVKKKKANVSLPGTHKTAHAPLGWKRVALTDVPRHRPNGGREAQGGRVQQCHRGRESAQGGVQERGLSGSLCATSNQHMPRCKDNAMPTTEPSSQRDLIEGADGLQLTQVSHITDSAHVV